MDVFYYWKEFENNVKEDMLGRFVSSREQLQKLKDATLIIFRRSSFRKDLEDSGVKVIAS